MRETAELVAIRKAVAVDLRIETADQEMIEIAERVLATEIDAARIGDTVTQRRDALLVEDLARHDLHAGRQIFELGAGLADRSHLLQGRSGIARVDGAARIGAAGLDRSRLRLVRSACDLRPGPRRFALGAPRRVGGGGAPPFRRGSRDFDRRELLARLRLLTAALRDGR